MRNTPSIGMARGRAPLPRPLGHRGAGLPSTSALEPSAEAQLRRKAKIRIGRPYPGAVNQAFTQGIGRSIDRSTTCLSRAARLDSRPCASLQFSKEEGSTERKGRGGGKAKEIFLHFLILSLSNSALSPPSYFLQNHYFRSKHNNQPDSRNPTTSDWNSQHS